MNTSRIKKVFWLSFLSICILISLTSIPTSAANDSPQNTINSNTDQLIVKLKGLSRKAKIGDYHVVEHAVGDNPSLVTIEIPDNENMNQAIKEIGSRKGVEYAEPDYKFKIKSVPNDPLYPKQWFHKVIKTEAAWDKTKGSSNVIVAIIDDGIDPDQKDLSSQIVFPFDVVDDTGQYISVGEHGTHVAGIIAAAANNQTGGSGVAPNVKIMPINVFSVDAAGDEGAYITDIIKGIHYAIEHGAKVINMSLGGYEKSEALNEAIQNAYKSGVVVVAAAGNDHSAKKTYPASYDHVISVASTDFDDSISYFSNYGDSIDISAPGSDIWSTLPDNEYGPMSGTSMATPVASGVAALIWSVHPNSTNSQIIDYLLNSADDLGAYSKDSIFGWGRVNAANALQLNFLSRPIINLFSDKDQFITGKIPTVLKSGQLIVSNKLGVVGTPINIAGKSSFSIKIPMQKAGTILNVQLIQSSVSKCLPVILNVLDRTAPKLPVINEIGDSTSLIKGKAEPFAKINIWSGTKKLGETTVRNTGEFSLKLTPQKAGSLLSLYISDTAKNKSQPLKIIVKDKTAPKIAKVYKVSNLDKKISGIGEAYSKIIIKAGSKKIGETIVPKNKYFVVKIPKQKQNTKLTIISVDRAKNQSHPDVVTVLDRIPPKKPVIYPISHRTTIVMGSTEPYAKVIIKSNRAELGEGKASSKGNYLIEMKKQKVGTSIYAYAYDHSGNRSVGSTKVK